MFHWPLFLISSHIGRGCHTNKTTDTIQVGWIIARSSKHNALVRSSERGSPSLASSKCTRWALSQPVRFSHSLLGGQAGGTSSKRWDILKEYRTSAHALRGTGSQPQDFVVGFCLVRALSQLPSSSLTFCLADRPVGHPQRIPHRCTPLEALVRIHRSLVDASCRLHFYEERAHIAHASQMSVTCVARDQSIRRRQRSENSFWAGSIHCSGLDDTSWGAFALSACGNSTEATQGTSLSNLPGLQHAIPGRQSGPSTSESSSTRWV